MNILSSGKITAMRKTHGNPLSIFPIVKNCLMNLTRNLKGIITNIDVLINCIINYPKNLSNLSNLPKFVSQRGQKCSTSRQSLT
jgi:hypothetical protein